MPPGRQQYDAEVVKALSVPYRPQSTPFTCGPACLQMMLAHQGIRISHLLATLELKAFPDGTNLGRSQSVYRKLTRITFRGVRMALNRGVPVSAVDSFSTPFDNLILVTGHTGDMFRVRDPTPFSSGKAFPRAGGLRMT